MLESLTTEKFEYKRIPLEEQKRRGILGRLVGVIADTINPTRNGRKYSAELWENVFNNDIMKEKIANRCVLGELGHPSDREEIDMEKVAVCLAENPKKGKDGKLYGVFDILDTTNGRILKTLCDYGTNVGISSRGSGDLYTDMEGQEAVDPDTYSCECFDIVLVPGVKEARLNYVTESLNTKKYNKTLKQKLTEELNNANEEDRKVMKETLENLDINLDESVIITKSSSIEPEKEFKVREVGYNSADGKKLFRVDTGKGEKWIPESEVKYEIDSDEPVQEPEVIEEPEDTITEGDESNFVKQNWDKILKGLNLMGGSRESLDKIYEEIKNLKESDLVDNEIVNDDDHEEDFIDDSILESVKNKAVKESLDLEMEDDFMLYSDLTHAIYGAIEDILSNDPNGVASKVSEEDIKGAVEEAILRYQDEHELGEGCKNESISEGCGDKKEEEKDAGNAGDLKELQEALTKANQLEKDNLSLQEKLSVCNAKEVKLEEELKKYKTSTANLSVLAKESKSLKEEKETLSKQLESKEKLLESNKSRLERLLSQKQEYISKLKESNNKVDDLENQVVSLNENLSKVNEKLDKYGLTIKKYQVALKESKESYIKAKADSYNLTVDEVKSNLNESYKLKDVDSICEELHNQKKNLSKLPFRITEGTKINVKASSNESIKGNRFFDDDNVDSLLKMTNLLD